MSRQTPRTRPSATEDPVSNEPNESPAFYDEEIPAARRWTGSRSWEPDVRLLADPCFTLAEYLTSWSRSS